MPDLIRHPEFDWIPAYAGMTNIRVFYCRVNNMTVMAVLKDEAAAKDPRLQENN
jgi:hypothetical protein